jgi:DNA modification methylase
MMDHCAAGNATRHDIIQGDCLEALRTMPDASVHCCVTSPPYWGLRDYGHDGQIGLESSPEAYVARMVEVFREVRRVLRKDGTCWLNLGDSYNAFNGNRGACTSFQAATEVACPSLPKGSGLSRKTLKNKDLVGIPWRVAFALQADGWWLRQDIIWHKPNPMPESVRDRCTKAHEYVFLLTKNDRYHYDAEAISEPVAVSTTARLSQPSLALQRGSDRVPGKTNGPMKAVGPRFGGNKFGDSDDPKHATKSGNVYQIPDANGRRNRRSVWTVSTKPYRGAHFATMPPDLVEPCLLAGCPSQCCAKCGAGYQRVTSKVRKPTRPGADTKVTGDSAVEGNRDPQRHVTTTTTHGWKPACKCGDVGVTPGVVLDPFAGSGTTLAVAKTLGRSGIGCELNPEYIKLAEARIAQAQPKTPLFGATA